jgi:hypothetical protein
VFLPGSRVRQGPIFRTRGAVGEPRAVLHDTPRVPWCLDVLLRAR